MSPQLLKLERKKRLLQARLLLLRQADDESALHSAMQPSVRKVLAGKKLLFWKSLLLQYGFDDMGIFDHMVNGVPLVGMPDCPPCYPAKVVPATLTEEDLRTSARWRRKAILGRKVNSIEPEHVRHLEDATKEEVDMSFLEGPFDSEQQVTDHLGHSDWAAIRRFVLVQGSEMKLRPIADCLEAQLNFAYTSTFYLKLQDVDYVAGMALKIAEAVKSGCQSHGSGRWLGKCLDLSKAYKQLAVKPAHRDLAVIFFHDNSGRAKFYISNALMFGSTTAVYSFNRVSRSLWYLLNKMLLIPTSFFYDDFPMFSPEETAEDADAAASFLLDLLGWRHARTGPKGLPFRYTFDVLGATLDLNETVAGVITVGNKAGRIRRLVEHLEAHHASGNLTLHESQVLHGLLRYSSGFYLGKALHQLSAEALALGRLPSRNKSLLIRAFCEQAVDLLKTSKPRRLVSGSAVEPILVFTDGSWEQGVAGIGACIHDTRDGSSWVFSGLVPQSLLDFWLVEVGNQLICQIELFTLVLIRWTTRELLHARRSIFWVDNEAARFGLIKGLSASKSMQRLIKAFYLVDVDLPTHSWIERVPSSSNVADAPSRQRSHEVMPLFRNATCCEFPFPSELLDMVSPG